MTGARAFPAVFTVALRSRGVLAALAPVVVLVMVYTILHRTAAYAASSAELASRLIRESLVLEATGQCRGGGCVYSCVVEAELAGRRVTLPLTVANGSVLGVDTASLEGGVSLGYLAARELNASQGDILVIRRGGVEWRVGVAGVHRTHSALDAQAVAAWAPFPCRDWALEPRTRGAGEFAAALAGEVAGSLRQWSLLALAALAVASAVASAKAHMDLEGAARALGEQGIPEWLLTSSIAALSALAALTGYAYGVVAFDALAALAGSLAGAYIPPPPPTPAEALESAVAPALVAAASTLAGSLAWRR